MDHARHTDVGFVRGAIEAFDLILEHVWGHLARELEAKKRPNDLVQVLQERVEFVGERQSIRVFWKSTEALRYAGCNRLFAEDGGREHPFELVGLQDYDMPWRLQAAKYRHDDLAVYFSGKPKLGILECQSNSHGFVYLDTSKAPILVDGDPMGILGMYELIDQQTSAARAKEREG